MNDPLGKNGGVFVETFNGANSQLPWLCPSRPYAVVYSGRDGRLTSIPERLWDKLHGQDLFPTAVAAIIDGIETAVRIGRPLTSDDGK